MDGSISSAEVRARRRKLHTEAEQRRRDAIKRGFDSLLELIPPVKSGTGNSVFRMSKATILNRSISMILKASKLQTQKELEIETLRKKVQALQILKASYERMSSTCSYATEAQGSVITEQFKLQLFQMFMENLFQSFDSFVSQSALPELSEQIITWLESICKPEFLHRTMEHLLESALHDGYALTNHQQQQQPSPMFELPHEPDPSRQSIQPQERILNTYRRQSLELSGSRETVHEPSFPVSDTLHQEQGTMYADERYHQQSCQHMFNNVYDPRTVFSETEQNFARPVPPPPPSLFPTRQYQSSEDSINSAPGASLSDKYPAAQHHSSPTSSVFQRAPSSGTSRSLVVNSTLPAPQFTPVPNFVASEAGFSRPLPPPPPPPPPPLNYGGRLPQHNRPYTKKSPF
ncbi:unnamed protein product [Mesocestoides corti]|uniref:BHLH domain-containing protein n=2 Tax=Mesocestoides corti TaxID=53468 RepID=A0A0R3U6X0_MESCO|nr:unnamed protein product [Mesocestoides corti]